jgi:hypothetical protein
MKLLSVEFFGKDLVHGYAEDTDEYLRFEGGKNGVKKQASYPKNKYTDYKHFAGVIGKFDPEAKFYKEPKELKVLTFEEIQKAQDKIKKALAFDEIANELDDIKEFGA